MNNNYELMIINRGQVYFPAVIEPVVWEDELKGSPSKLTFTVIKGQKLNFQEGNPVRFKYNGKEIFFGFVFTKKRNKEHHIEVTCYDQIRYLNNKNTVIFENKTASEIISTISKINPSLNLGQIDDTQLKIKSLVFDNESYLDMIYEALDITLTQRKKGYVLYDNFGKLQLQDIDNMIVEDFIITDNNSQDFDYVSTIDENVYNQIILLHEDEKTGKRVYSTAKDQGNIDKWGLLQYFENIDDNVNGKLKADTLLSLYNRKSRKLTLKGVRGKESLRAGCRIMVMLNLGDIIVQNYLIVNSVKHEFRESEHIMDLVLIGGGFSA